jgi:WD40 repeat protein/tetratricopeptide (TPR) repeat protein
VLALGQRSWIQGERSSWLSGYAGRDVTALANPAQAGSIPALGSVVAVLWKWNLKPDTRVWDVATGQPVTPSLTHGAGITEAQISPDGRRVLTVGGTAARVWDAATGRAIATLKHDDEPLGELSEATFSPDGRRILALCVKDHTARAWDAVTGQQVTTPLRHLHIQAASFSPDGSRVLTHSQPENWNWISQDFAEARVWDVQTGLPISPPLRTERVSFSPEGLRLLTLSKSDARTRDAATGEPLTAIVKPGLHPIFSPEGRYVATTDGERTVYLWDVARRPPLTPPVRLDGPVDLAALSADGRRVAAGSWSGLLRVWDTITGQPLTPTLKADGELFRLAFSPDGRWLLALSGDSDKERGVAQVWEVATGRMLFPPIKHGGGVRYAAFSPDSSSLVTAAHEDPTARVWEVATGRAVTSVRKHDGWIGGATFSADGRRLLTVMGVLPGGEAQVWDVATGKPLTPPLRHERGLIIGAFSPDGRLVLTVGDSGPTYDVRVWDSATGRLLTTLNHDGWIRDATFSPDSRLVLIAGDRVRVHDVTSGQPLTPPLGHELRMQKACFSPDSTRVLTAGGDRDTAGEARVWDAGSGQPLTPPLRHAFGVEEASFSADGRYVLTLSAGAARVWEAASGLPVTPPLLSGKQVKWTAFTPDSRRVLTANASTVRVWDLSPDPRSVDDLVCLAQVLSGHRMSDSGTISSLNANALQKEWQTLRSKVPEEIRPNFPDMRAWHQQEIEDALSFTQRTYYGWNEGVYAFDDRPEWFAAIFHLDTLIAAEPNSVALLLQRAALHSRLGQWDRAADDYAKAVAQGAEGWQPWHECGLAHAQLGQWDKASDCFTRAVAFADAPAEVWAHHGVVRLHLGDLKGFRTACERLLERFSDADPFAVTQTCALAPAAVADLPRLVRLVEKAHAKNGNSYSLATLGALLYRAGRYGEAAGKLTEATRQYSQGETERAWLFLAMADHRLGRRDEAKQTLDRAVQGFERLAREKAKAAPEDNARFWAQRLEFEILRGEAAALVQGTKP